MTTCLLIDVGSTTIKWAIFNPTNGVKSVVSSLPFPMPMTNKPPLFEVNAEEIIQLLMEVIQNSTPLDHMFISTQMHGYLLSASDGELLVPYISWQDQRSTLTWNGRRFLDQFPLRLSPESGTIVKPNSPICSLFAMKHLEPERFSQATQFYTLGSYIAYRLTGVNATHISDAAACGMYNKEDGTPQYNMYPTLQLPQATIKVQPIGYWNNVTVYSPIGDQQASILGSLADCERQYILNLGTAAQMCVVSDLFVAGDFESRPYFDGKTLCTVSGLLGGREIVAQSASPDFVELLAHNYLSAMNKLPAREQLLVIGGVSRHHRELISQVCDRLQIAFQLCPDRDALDGLIELIKEVKPS